MNRTLLFLVCIFFGWTAQARYYPVTGWNFDWDDNIFNMPTQIRLWTETGEEVGVSTAQFALIREQIGKPGAWAGHRFRPDPVSGSLRYFGDESEIADVFLKDVRAALAKPGWQGPSWKAFVKAMSHRETARQTSIITARMHSPQTLYNALKVLQSEGYIRYTPLRRNIFPVGYQGMPPDFRGSSSSPSEAKTRVMGFIMDRLNAIPFTKNSPLVTHPDGTHSAQLHLWGFSDDDYGNYAAAVKYLSANIGRWPRVKITLFFTGTNNPAQKPRVEILTSQGTLRSALPTERSAGQLELRTGDCGPLLLGAESPATRS